MITLRLNKMLIYIVILFALTPCCWSAVNPASKCDVNIIKGIKEKNWNHGTPKDIMKTGMTLGKMPILKTAAGHYSDEQQINCAYVQFSATSVNLVVKYDKSSNLQDQQKKFDITEKDGDLIDNATKQHRYYLTSGNGGVRCYYRCSDTGPTGAPDGLIEASEHGYKKEALDKCIKDLESLGIKMSTKNFNNHCAA